MTKLQRLFAEYGQSPWLDDLKRSDLTGGELARRLGEGIRGVTSNPTIMQRAIEGETDYDQQYRALVEKRVPVIDAYWDLVIADATQALAMLRPVYDESSGGDGFVSIELDPALAHDTQGSIVAARGLHDRINEPNGFVKIPATPEGVAAIQQMIAEGRSINVTLVFSLERYEEVIEAYFAGLETFSGDLAGVHSVASFFVSRVDSEVDRRLEAIGTPAALELRGHAAVAQAKLAYARFRHHFSGPRWGGTGGSGCPSAAAPVGFHLHQEPLLSRHAVCGQPHRARHHQYAARSDHRRV
jgi:transaldolase